MFFFFSTASVDPGDDPEVVRAKYFIRDEFLVGTLSVWSGSDFP